MRHIGSRHNAQCYELCLRSVAGVKLHGQIDELKKHRGSKECDAQPCQGRKGHSEPDHKHDEPEAAPKIGHSHGRIANGHERIALRVLQCMPSLVRGDTHGRQRTTAVHPFRQSQNLRLWIVVVCELPGHLFDGYVGCTS